MRSSRLMLRMLTLSCLMSAWSPTFAADAFGSGSGGGRSVTPELLARIEKLEKAMEGKSSVASPVKPDEKGLTLPTPPDISDESLTSFVKLGELNGKVLVKQGEKRFVFTHAEYQAFLAKERDKPKQTELPIPLGADGKPLPPGAAAKSPSPPPPPPAPATNAAAKPAPAKTPPGPINAKK